MSGKIDKKVEEIIAGEKKLEEVLDDLILKDPANPIEVLLILMRAFGLRLIQAKPIMEKRCWELKNRGHNG